MFLLFPIAMMNGNIDFTLNHMHYCTLDKLYHRLTEYHIANYTDYGKNDAVLPLILMFYPKE